MSNPRIIKPSIHLQLRQTAFENDGLPGRYRPSRCGNHILGIVEPSPPGEDNIPSPDHKYFHTLQLRPTGDGNGAPPGRYLPSWCGNPNLGFVKPAPPAEDNNLSADQKSFHTSTTPTNRGRRRWSPGSIPPPMVWKPQPRVLKAIAIREV